MAKRPEYSTQLSAEKATKYLKELDDWNEAKAQGTRSSNSAAAEDVRTTFQHVSDQVCSLFSLSLCFAVFNNLRSSPSCTIAQVPSHLCLRHEPTSTTSPCLNSLDRRTRSTICSKFTTSTASTSPSNLNHGLSRRERRKPVGFYLLVTYDTY